VQTDDLNFHLPAELIAQAPAPDRDESRLLHYQSSSRTIAHRQFSDLPSLLRAGDVLVFNDSKVIPARFTLRKNTGGRIEGLFVSVESNGTWRVLLRNLGAVKDVIHLHFADAPEVEVAVTEHLGEGEYRMRVNSSDPANVLLARIGRMPLPPYIRREKEHDALDDVDRERYQTVYAKEDGSVAAPTAGLHFTPQLLEEIRGKGVEEVFVTLHVGLGTFKPVAADELSEHKMHSEIYSLPQETVDRINLAKRENRRVIAVGTTSARVLESQPAGELSPRTDETSIFIYPPYEWKHVDAMITNFHLPKSTLIALVAAKVGLDEQRHIYREAIEKRYRFFSYGDASFLE
jgi:S-adenosylmethionine:tRNA ribosyltransferase-isomerase